MAAPDDALKAQIAGWFASVDPAMQQVLQTIYEEAPAAVSKAISGGAWVADAGDPPLAEIIGGGNTIDQAGLRFGGFQVDPWPLAPGLDAKLTWTVMNGATAHPAFRTEIKVTAPDGSEKTETLQTEAMEPNQLLEQAYTISAAVEGNYNVDIDVNPEGAPEGGPPSEKGTRLNYPGISIMVQSAEAAATDQAGTGLSYAIGSLLELVSNVEWSYARDRIYESCNYFAGVDTLSADQLKVPADLYAAVASATESGSVFAQANPDDVERVLRPEVDAALSALGVAANRAIATPTPEGAQPVLDAMLVLKDAL